jgi:hypothetical protein
MPGRILPYTYWVLAVAGTLALAQPAPADPRDQSHGWKFDVVYLRTGKILRGLVLEETSGTVQFQCIRQDPGEPTKLGPVTRFMADEIRRIDRLNPSERAKLEARLERLKPACEQQRMAAIELQPVPWRGQGNGALCYRAEHFVLIARAGEDIVRRTALRLEQIYEAYTRFLPPRCQQAAPTQILLVSTAEYRQMLQNQAGSILNPAFFDPAKNQIVCGTDLLQLEEKLEVLRKRHQQLRDLVKQQQVTLREVYKNHPPEAFRKQQAAVLKELKEADEANAKTFEKAMQCLFRTLYHEAFHAYLAGFVYPPAAADVPRWLNEGLAQVFETAILEAGELRVSQPDPERLRRVKDALRKHQLVALPELLTADPDKFLVGHAANPHVSDAYYLDSWALAYYLMFAQRKLGTPELDEYVRSLRAGAEPLGAFSKLVGEPLPVFEGSFQRYLRMLGPNGNTAK